MPSIGPLEMLVVGIIAFVVLGPDKLPGMARSLGKAISEFKAHANGLRSEFEGSMNARPDDDDRVDANSSHQDNHPGSVDEPAVTAAATTQKI